MTAFSTLQINVNRSPSLIYNGRIGQLSEAFLSSDGSAAAGSCLVSDAGGYGPG